MASEVLRELKQDILDKLGQPYSRNRQDHGRGLSVALGVDAPEVHVLEAEIRCDFDRTDGGITWWKGHLDGRHNSLMGPYLAQLVWSVQYNLLEAGVHLVESEDWAERESSQVSRGVVATADGLPSIAMPRPQCPADELPQPMVDLHRCGFVRSLASALDCMGGALAGVAGLKIELIRCGWNTALRALSREQGLAELFASLNMRIREAGPEGWLAWTLSYRNMFVHRARRLEARQLRPRFSLYGPRGERIFRTEVIHHLVRDPQLSEIQAWRDPQRAGVLTEDAAHTLRGLRDTVVMFIRGAAEDLASLWQKRRQSGLIAQPSEQWPSADNELGTFNGYVPGSVEFDPRLFAAFPTAVEALQAGQVLDDHRKNRWEGGHDETPQSG